MTRFAAIRLSRYGIFEDARFAFPHTAGEPDLHLVVGPNEAGKTTLRQALVDALFGIPTGSRYAFGAARPVVTAEIETPDGPIIAEWAIGKRKPKPVDAAAQLEAALGGRDRTTFLATRAFSHDEMRDNARLLAESRGALKDLLERDSGGLARVGPLLDQLRVEADDLFKSDGRNKKNAFRTAEKERNAALGAIRGSLDAEHHRQLIEDLEQAVRRRDRLRRDAAVAHETAERLKAEKRAEGLVAELARLEADRMDLASCRLEHGAAERVHAAAIEEAQARTDMESAEKRRLARIEERAAIALDPAVIDLSTEIEALDARRTRLAARAEERIAQDTAANSAEEAACAAARSIGLTASSPGEIARAVPTAVDRRDASRRMAARASAEQAVKAAQKALEDTIAEPPPEVPKGPGEALLRAIRDIHALGHYREAWRDALLREVAAEDGVARAREAAAGDCAADAPPPLEEGIDAEGRIEAAQRALDTVDERIRENEKTRVSRAEAVRLATVGDVPTEDVLAAARAVRDALWREFVAGRPVADAAAHYERHVIEADRVADVRFAKNNEILKAERARDDLAVAERDRIDLSAAREARRAELDAVRRAWRERLSAAGMPAVPTDYRAWSARRQALREALREQEQARAARGRLADRLRQAVHGAAAALGTTPMGTVEGDDLLHAVEAASEAVSAEKARRDEAVAAAKAARDEHAKRMRERPAREQALGAAKRALADWWEGWRPLADVLRGSRDDRAGAAAGRSGALCSDRDRS